MLKSRIRSFKFAGIGIRELFTSQPNARIHLFVALVVTVSGFLLKISILEWCIVIVTIFGVLAAEAFNSAIENLTDLVSPDFHPLAGKTKDLAAAAVLFMAIGAVLVGFLIFGPKIWTLLN
ncbi:MAG: diacylglycerol kinase family protein [Saprospiraceae bacterium]|nr:diacylglycerol kinase family protein [Saprospiraceae bacterium]